MSNNNHFRGLIAQDTQPSDDGDVQGFALPVSQAEIEELLYGDDWSLPERRRRLESLRQELAELESSDWGGDDPQTLVRSIDDALARLDGVAGEGMDPTSVDHDASAHRETLSPDSDELDALNADDEASLAENEAEPRQL